MEALAAGPPDAQKSFSWHRESGRQPALKDFLFLETADSLPNTSAVS